MLTRWSAAPRSIVSGRLDPAPAIFRRAFLLLNLESDNGAALRCLLSYGQQRRLNSMILRQTLAPARTPSSGSFSSRETGGTSGDRLRCVGKSTENENPISKGFRQRAPWLIMVPRGFFSQILTPSPLN